MFNSFYSNKEPFFKKNNSSFISDGLKTVTYAKVSPKKLVNPKEKAGNEEAEEEKEEEEFPITDMF